VDLFFSAVRRKFFEFSYSFGRYLVVVDRRTPPLECVDLFSCLQFPTEDLLLATEFPPPFGRLRLTPPFFNFYDFFISLIVRLQALANSLLALFPNALPPFLRCIFSFAMRKLIDFLLSLWRDLLTFPISHIFLCAFFLPF